jgi:hypothetical protein
MEKTYARQAVNRTLRAAASPIETAMRGLAPAGLKDTITTSARLSKRQRRLNVRFAERSALELFVGPSYEIGRGGRQAHLLEFGTKERRQKKGRRTGRIRARPFVRPAWDAEQRNALSIIKTQLWQEIDKATQRAQRKAARDAAKLARG